MNFFKFSVLILTFLVIGCGNSTKTEEKSIYKRTKIEKNEIKQAYNITPVDLNNKGLGPIKDYSFEVEINEEFALEGKKIFNAKCTACHNVNRRLIGPSMKGIYERRSPEWVMNIMLNPDQMLKEDPIGKALLKEYNNIIMINQNLSVEEAEKLAEYFRTL
jgi:mono/diheme cytochrome c family protein